MLDEDDWLICSSFRTWLAYLPLFPDVTGLFAPFSGRDEHMLFLSGRGWLIYVAVSLDRPRGRTPDLTGLYFSLLLYYSQA